MLTEKQLKQLKNDLLKSQERMNIQVQDRFGLEVSKMDAVGDLSSYDNHPADMGTELYERGKDIALNEHTEQELEDINKALHAMEEGTYGICCICSVDIPYERLRAVPTADTCIQHSEEEQTFSRYSSDVDKVYRPNIKVE